MINIFQTYRDFGFPVTSESFIKFESPAHNKDAAYCGNKSIYGSPPTALVDGNESTAYATLNTNDPSQQYIIMQFVQKPVYVNTLYFHSLCWPPSQLFIEGSNDHETWETIGVRNQEIPDNSVTPIHCFRRKHYTYIRLNQTRNTYQNAQKSYRLHIYHIDIYGTFGDLPRITCKYNVLLPKLFMFTIMLGVGHNS